MCHLHVSRGLFCSWSTIVRPFLITLSSLSRVGRTYAHASFSDCPARLQSRPCCAVVNVTPSAHLATVRNEMSLAWLRHHARTRQRGIIRARSNSQRLAALRAHRQSAGVEVPASRITYDNSFIVDSSVTSRDAGWTSTEQCKRQYYRLGWEVTSVRKDGNCLFRALSDQLYGHERRHLELRRRLVDFIDLERAFFEPFVAGQGIVEYCSRLREAGAWGGHPELVAASRLLGVNIIVHTGPVKRLHIDTDKYARMKEGKGKTLNLLLKHEHYSSLRKSQKPLHQQHGCSDSCLCKRIVTSSRASLDHRPSLDARSDSGSSFDSQRSSDLDTRNSLVDGGSEKRRRAPMVKGAYGRKSVPDADISISEDASMRKKLDMTPAKPKSRPPPPPGKPRSVAPAPPSHSVRAKPTTPAPAAPARPKAPISAPPIKSVSLVHAADNKPKAVEPSTRSQPPTPVQHKAASPRTKPRASMPSTARKSKGPGVVLFQPEPLKPMKPRAPLAVLFDPEQAPISRPRSTPVYTKETMNATTPAKPNSAMVLKVGVEEPEMISGSHVKMPQCGIYLPRRAVFNGGKRRRSSAAALALLQEVSASLNTTDSKAMGTKVKPMMTVFKPVTVVKPLVTVVKSAITVEPVAPTNEAVAPAKLNPSAPCSMEIKKSSKKVFRQGRPVAAH